MTSSSNNNSNNNKIYLVTGSNIGLGLDAARQLALKEETKRVYLACRTESKALAAIASLVKDYSIPKEKLVFVPFDASASKETISTKILAALLPNNDPHDDNKNKIDGLIFNAGGMGYDNSGRAIGPNKVLDMFQINLIGHIHLLDALQSNNYLKPNETAVVYSGSEVARGVPVMAMSAPKLPKSLDGYKKVINGTTSSSSSKKQQKLDTMELYGQVKAIAALYWAAWARGNPQYYVISVSPGATHGTAIAGHKSIPKAMRAVFPAAFRVMGFLGMAHPVEVGAKRYVDAVDREGAFEQFESGSFVASAHGVSGRVKDQTKHPRGARFADIKQQDIVYNAVQAFA
jgi:NAD(P)-dependent dehydrogenase (short-subunit alcohol dehydrogenase family)